MSTVAMNQLKSITPKTDLQRSNDSDKKSLEPTEAFQIVKRSLEFLSKIGMLLGADMRFDWKISKRFIMTRAAIIFVWSQIFYTHGVYIYHNEAMRNCELLPIYGIGVSGYLKLKSFEKNFKKITALFTSTLKICQQNGDNEKFKNRLIYNFEFYKFVASMAIIIIFLYIFYPLKSFLMDGLLVPFIPIEIMFVDQSTTIGFLIASPIMITLGVYATFGTGYMALTFVAVILNYGPRVDIMEKDFNQLDKMWRDTSTTTLVHRHMFLRNICRKYADMQEYITEVKRIFDTKLFIFFVFAYLSQIMCMYQVRANNWIPGYALAIGFFLEMMFYCLMGTKLTKENDRFCYLITQSHWYTYDQWSQRMILLLLSEAINSEELMIGQLAPLNVYTGTEIVKSIYSYYTLMMEVV